jgi:hypothetical protein
LRVRDVSDEVDSSLVRGDVPQLESIKPTHKTRAREKGVPVSRVQRLMRRERSR